VASKANRLQVHMYAYTEFDQTFIEQRAAQYRDQLNRWQSGALSEDEFKPLRLQNGWYVQRFAPMLRVAIPYGVVSSRQLRVLAEIARTYDHKDLSSIDTTVAGLSDVTSLPDHCAHFTTRQNVQFNWIPLSKSADVMDLLATAGLHGIQTSGNCIRNTTTDAFAGIAPDELVDPRPFAELIRQWSTLHPEFAFLPRKFKVAITGASEDRAATRWHDVGLRLVANDDDDLGFEVSVGGGMGRTPVIGRILRSFVPAFDILDYLTAVIRVYNRWGRRDNLYKARIKILVKAEGQAYIDEVDAEFEALQTVDGSPNRITATRFAEGAAAFSPPSRDQGAIPTQEKIAAILAAASRDEAGFDSWLIQNVRPHKVPHLRAVTLSFKRVGHAPGDATAAQLDAAAQLADTYSAGELRVTHTQNLVLPWVRCDALPALWRDAKALGLAKPNIGLLTDMIACPGGDFCSLANARSLSLASAITARYQDLDELMDLGAIDLHISGCINSCGHHHSGHIGILGVDKDGQEWYQITLAGSDGASIGGEARPGRVVGPAFAADEVVGAIEAILDTYNRLRVRGEAFIATLDRVGHDPFKAAAHQARLATA
jgi:sulfite reductase (NADPH) hemoprotein beta-component